MMRMNKPFNLDKALYNFNRKRTIRFGAVGLATPPTVPVASGGIPNLLLDPSFKTALTSYRGQLEAWDPQPYISAVMAAGEPKDYGGTYSSAVRAWITNMKDWIARRSIYLSEIVTTTYDATYYTFTIKYPKILGIAPPTPPGDYAVDDVWSSEYAGMLNTWKSAMKAWVNEWFTWMDYTEQQRIAAEEASASECPPGYTYTNGKCVADETEQPTCPENQMLVNGACVDQCTAPYNWDATLKKCIPPCVANEKWDDALGKCVPTQPADDEPDENADQSPEDEHDPAPNPDETDPNPSYTPPVYSDFTQGTSTSKLPLALVAGGGLVGIVALIIGGFLIFKKDEEE